MSFDNYTTIGMDVSDRKIQVCVMAKSGVNPKIVKEATIPTTKEGLQKFLSTHDKNSPVVFETGTHSRWMNETAERMGFKVSVANPCRLKMITESKTKNDINDARMLARIALSDPGLLHPVKLRDAEHQKMLNLHEMRNLLVKQRTAAIVQMRSIAKSMGFRIPKTSTNYFHKLDRSSWPKDFSDIAWPMMKNLEQLDITIKTYEKQIRELAETPTFKAQVDRLKEIHYVGLYAATGFVAITGGNMDRFEKPRDIGPWLGLSPKQDQSGDIDKQCHITKAGSPFMRRLLVECAQMILRDGAIETNLKIKGMRICARGAKIAKRKAITAVARSLAVLMAAMLKKMDAPYVPLSETKERELAAILASA
jgi:transposase